MCRTAGIGAHKALFGGRKGGEELPLGGARVDAVAVGRREGGIAQVGHSDACIAVQKAVDHDGGLGVAHIGVDARHNRIAFVHLCCHLAHKGVLQQCLAVVDADKLVHIAVQAVVRSSRDEHVVVVVCAVGFALQHAVFASVPGVAGGALGCFDASHLARFACGTSVGAQGHRLAFAGKIAGRIVTLRRAVAGSNLDAYRFVEQTVQVHHNLVPVAIDVAVLVVVVGRLQRAELG